MSNRIAVMEREIKKNGFVHSVYDESPYGIIVFTAEMMVVDWNPAVQSLIGLSREGCMGKHILEVFPSTETIESYQANGTKIKGTLVIAEAISAHFISGMLNGIKISIVVDKSGAVNGGTLILTPSYSIN